MSIRTRPAHAVGTIRTYSSPGPSGAPGPWPDLLDRQVAHLSTVRRLVATSAHGRPQLTPEETEQVVREIRVRFPERPTAVPEAAALAAGLPPLDVLDVGAVARELADGRTAGAEAGA